MALLYIILAVLLAWFFWEKNHRKTSPVKGGLQADISLPYSEEFELYHNDLSLCSKKVRVCLAELGISYKAHHIDLIETRCYETLGRRYLAVNPSGVVPTLVHNGHPIYESHDIIAYIAEFAAESGTASLIPPEEASRQLMQTWMDKASMQGDDPISGPEVSAAGCTALLTTPLFSAGMVAIPAYRVIEGLLFHRLRFRPFLFMMLKLRGLEGFVKIPPLMKALGRGRNGMQAHLEALESQLESTGPFITGEQLTLADISWLVIFERLVEADWIDYFMGADKLPACQAYWQRLQQTPGYLGGIEGFRHPTVAVATALLQAQKLKDPAFKAALEPAIQL
jgi:glutathione S-transferase